MTDLTILTISQNQPYAQPFLRAHSKLARDLDATRVLLIDGKDVPSCEGLMESQLDHAISLTRTQYILEISDDEQPSPAMIEWLAARAYQEHDLWCFPLACLYPDRHHYISSEPLWPDYQTRLSTREKAGGRHRVHAGSPHGRGQIAPCALEHHKYIARTRQQREATLARYEELGAGDYFRIFSLPEDFDVETKPYEPMMAAA